MHIQKSKSRYFLAELIVNCMFFVIGASICISIFANGYTLSTNSHELSMSTLKAQNTAECIKSCNGNVEEFIQLTGAELNEGTYYIYFDDNWLQTQSDTATFTMSVNFNVDDINILNSDITVYNLNETIYNLNFNRYIGLAGGVGL